MLVARHIGPSVRDWRPQRLTDLELVRFVADVVNDRVLLAQQVQPFDDVGCVFPALSFLHEITEDARREIGTCYEHRRLATGKARNGQPSFPTVKFIHREDWLRARDLIAAELLRRERV